MKDIKYRTLVETLKTNILSGKYGAQSSFPSMRALISRFGLSKTTVQRALDELFNQGLISRKQGRGTFVNSEGVSRKIGLIIPGMCYGEIFPSICREISKLAQAAGYVVLFGDVSSEDPKARARMAGDLARKFAAERVSGVIYQPIEFLRDMERINRRIVSVFDAARIPVVLIDWDIVPSPDRSAYDLVGINNFEAGRRVAEHLVAQGARCIRFLTWRNCAYSVANRISGVRSVVPYGDKVQVTVNMSDVSAVRKVLSARPHPDALVCGNDTNAARLLVALRKLGKRVPEDICVVGFDDVQHAVLVQPALTTVRQPCADIARMAFRLLIERIKDADLPTRECLLSAPLVVRNSTRTGASDFRSAQTIQQGKTRSSKR